MRLCARTLAAALAVASVAAVPAQAHPATTIDCAGTVTVTPTAAPDVRVKGKHTIISFDFVAEHTLCLADGSQVTGTATGHSEQRLGSDGGMKLEFDELVSYGDGTLRFKGAASLKDGVWRSDVHTVGHGTGILAGMKGSGSFWPTADQSVFSDLITYRYH